MMVPHCRADGMKQGIRKRTPNVKARYWLRQTVASSTVLLVEST
jgi:hypothetical protein